MPNFAWATYIYTRCAITCLCFPMLYNVVVTDIFPCVVQAVQDGIQEKVPALLPLPVRWWTIPKIVVGEDPDDQRAAEPVGQGYLVSRSSRAQEESWRIQSKPTRAWRPMHAYTDLACPKSCCSSEISSTTFVINNTITYSSAGLCSIVSYNL